jgi:hypothetical protein
VVPASPRGIFVQITALLEQRSTKTAPGLRFEEVDLPMNSPLSPVGIGKNKTNPISRKENGPHGQ